MFFFFVLQENLMGEIFFLYYQNCNNVWRWWDFAVRSKKPRRSWSVGSRVSRRCVVRTEGSLIQGYRQRSRPRGLGHGRGHPGRNGSMRYSDTSVACVYLGSETGIPDPVPEVCETAARCHRLRHPPFPAWLSQLKMTIRPPRLSTNDRDTTARRLRIKENYRFFFFVFCIFPTSGRFVGMPEFFFTICGIHRWHYNSRRLGSSPTPLRIRFFNKARGRRYLLIQSCCVQRLLFHVSNRSPLHILYRVYKFR